jgi:hypothetical protein
LAGKHYAMTKSLAKLRAFSDAEDKQNVTGNGSRPIERVPIKIVMPRRELLYARLCPFCRKARGKIQLISSKQFQGVCPKCGANGPKRERAAQPFFQTPLACSLADGNVCLSSAKVEEFAIVSVQR